MQNVIAIFDVGKTNKKLFLFDEQYKIVWEQSEVCAQTTDEDGEPCEDIALLSDWVMRIADPGLDAPPGFKHQGRLISPLMAPVSCISVMTTRLPRPYIIT